MPLPSAIKLFIDPKLGLAFGNFAGSSQISNPTFTLGDTAGIEIYLVENTQVANYPRQEISFPATPGIKVAIGAIDQSPTAGTWLMSYGGNSTSALPYNATAAQLQTALNALASITAAGGVTVSKIGDNYNVAFNTAGVRTELTTDSTSLIPLSTAVVATLQAGTVSKPQISLVHLQRTVAGLATTFTQTAASQITVESLGAWDGSKATFRVSISPDPKGGTFTLGFDAQTGDDVSTASINVGASALDVQNALNIKALVDKVAVTQVGAYAYDITVSTQPGTAGLTANAAGLLSFSGYKGDLSLNTAEAISLLDGAESVETTLEVEVTSDSKTLTLLQIPCTLKNAVIDAGAVDPLVLDTYLSQTTADGRYLRQSNNLADLGSASTARTNLGVYSTSQVDTALALKADDSDLLQKADVIHTHIIGDVTGLQTALDAKAALAGAAFTGDVTTTGRMAIGGGLANNTDHKLAIYNGNVVFSAGFGLAFGDGTTQTTAATTPDLSGYAPLNSPTFSGLVGIGSSAITGRIRAESYALGSFLALEAGNGARQAVISNGGEFGNVPFITLIGSTGTASIHSGRFYSGSVGSGVEPYARVDGATFTGKANFTSVSGAAGLNVGIGGTSASATTAGDLWISTGGANLNFRDGTGAWKVLASLSNGNVFSAVQAINVTSTSTALRITQLGTGEAIRVEDSTSPDATSFIVGADGRVAIGANTATASVYTFYVNGVSELNGNLLIKEGFTLSFGSRSFVIENDPTTNAISGNLTATDYPTEIFLKIGGNNYAIPARIV